MDTLSFSTLRKVKYDGYVLENAPEKVLQFGEGGFLRAFIDYFIDMMNEKAGFNGKVVLVQPRGGHPEVSERFDAQDGLYTLILRGQENGDKVYRKRVISSVSRCLDPKSEWTCILDAACQESIRFIDKTTLCRTIEVLHKVVLICPKESMNKYRYYYLKSVHPSTGELSQSGAIFPMFF